MPTTPYVGQKMRASVLALVFAPIVGFGERTSNGTATTTGEKTFLRVDDISIIAGQAYEITTSPLIFQSTVASDLLQVNVKFSTSGAATTSSALLTVLAQKVHAGGAVGTVAQGTASLTITYNALVTSTSASLLLSYQRGSGSGNVLIQAASDIPAQVTMKWIGTSKADTGVDL